jgi:phosphopantetheine--protein transferase-like protein
MLNAECFGCGIDLVSIERVARLHRELGDDEKARIFGAGELAEARATRFPERRLARSFAAKEACLKLFPEEAAAGELAVEDIDVAAGPGAAIRVEPGERLRRAMERRGVGRILLSAGSSRVQAWAIAVSVERGAQGSDRALREAAERVRAFRPSLVGRAAYRLFPVRRGVILANIRRVFGDLLDDSGRRALAGAFYAHMARFLLETVAYAIRPIEVTAEEVRVENIEIPLLAAEEGKGLIILTGHFGNWEVACGAGILRFPQYRGRFHFLRRPISNRLIETFVLRKFRRAGLGVIPKKNSLLEILSLLEKNDALVFIMDQHASVPKDGVAVPFFGEPAGTFRSLALIAKASGAPVIPAHGWREAPGRHVLRFEEPVPWIDRDDPAEEVAENTRAYNAAIERMVLRHPEQWFWMHKRWKLRRSI